MHIKARELKICLAYNRPPFSIVQILPSAKSRRISNFTFYCPALRRSCIKAVKGFVFLRRLLVCIGICFQGVFFLRVCRLLGCAAVVDEVVDPMLVESVLCLLKTCLTGRKTPPYLLTYFLKLATTTTIITKIMFQGCVGFNHFKTDR